MVASHATAGSPCLGADGFDKFIEVHTLSHPVAQMIQLTGMIFEGCLRSIRACASASWRALLMAALLDGPHGRGGRRGRGGVLHEEAERLPGSGQLYFAAEGDEGSVPEVVRRLSDDIVFYATDVPHWDHDYPENLNEMASREDLSPESRRKILGDNARRLYGGVGAGASR
jgi:hypothetical protein